MVHQTIVFEVVGRDSERLFKVGDVFFDVLYAFDECEGGSLQVRRGDVVVAKTSSIQYYGTHGACNCFLGLSYDYSATDSISANDRIFAEGDILTLEFDTDKNFDFVGLLRLMGCFLAAASSHLEVGKSYKPDEVLKAISTGMATHLKEYGETSIIRLDPKPDDAE